MSVKESVYVLIHRSTLSFSVQVCQDKRNSKMKQEMALELDAPIQRVVDYFHVKFRREDANKYMSKLKSCRAAYTVSQSSDAIAECELMEDLRDPDERDEMEKCITDPLTER